MVATPFNFCPQRKNPILPQKGAVFTLVKNQMTDKPRRRWLRFSLRTLFVLVIVVVCWLGWNVSQVRQRNEMLVAAGVRHEAGPDYVYDTARFPVVWSYLGAEPISWLNLDPQTYGDAE